MVTYEVAGLEITAPLDWTALQRANAECELRHGHELTEPLGILALLEITAAVAPYMTTGMIAGAAADLLLDGWSPGDPVW